MVYTDFNSETGECLPKIRVLIADDHELIRQRLRDLLEKEPAMVVIGEARDGEQIRMSCGSIPVYLSVISTQIYLLKEWPEKP